LHPHGDLRRVDGARLPAVRAYAASATCADPFARG
jgi:hypothetical protein